MALSRRVLIGGASAAAFGLGLYACRHTMTSSTEDTDAPAAGAAQAAPEAAAAEAAAERHEAEGRFINTVLRENAEFDALAGAQPFEPEAQGVALAEIFDDAALRAICEGKVGARFAGCVAKFELWRPFPRAE